MDIPTIISSVIASVVPLLIYTMTANRELRSDIGALQVSQAAMQATWDGHITADNQFHGSLDQTLTRLNNTVERLEKEVNELHVALARLTGQAGP